MGKIIVPQELQEQIIDLYLNKKYSLRKIKDELKLEFSEHVIKRVLLENHIVMRNNVGAPKLKVPQELEQQIIEAYQKGYGLDKIVKELQLNFSFDKVRSILFDNNIHVRSVKESAQVKEMPDLRKFTINDNYNFNSHNGAWILGFIAADGYLPNGKGSKNRIVITLAEKDKEVLELIKNELNYSGQIYSFLSQGFPSVSLSFTSQKIRQEIEKHNITNNKSLTLNNVIETIPDEFKIDFIRGYFDGDGSILEPVGKKINISFVSGSKKFLESLIKYLNILCDLDTMPTIHETNRIHTTYSIKYYVKNSLIICDKMYNNDYLALPRKKQHYFSIKESSFK